MNLTGHNFILKSTQKFCDFIRFFSKFFVILHDFSLLTRYVSNDIKAGLFKVNSKSLPESSPSNFSSLSLESSESESKFRALEMSFWISFCHILIYHDQIR